MFVGSLLVSATVTELGGFVVFLGLFVCVCGGGGGGGGEGTESAVLLRNVLQIKDFLSFLEQLTASLSNPTRIKRKEKNCRRYWLLFSFFFFSFLLLVGSFFFPYFFLSAFCFGLFWILFSDFNSLQQNI